jgi:hypothetical protein
MMLFLASLWSVLTPDERENRFGLSSFLKAEGGIQRRPVVPFGVGFEKPPFEGPGRLTAWGMLENGEVF